MLEKYSQFSESSMAIHTSMIDRSPACLLQIGRVRLAFAGCTASMLSGQRSGLLSSRVALVRSCLEVSKSLSSLDGRRSMSCIKTEINRTSSAIGPITCKSRRLKGITAGSRVERRCHVCAAAGEQLLVDGQHEFVVVNFYHLVNIDRPHKLVEEHKEFLEDKDVRGRIYVSHQGVNAQFGGLRQDAEGYVKWIAETQPLFKGLRYSVDVVEGHMFPKLRLKYKPNLISLAGGMESLPITDPSARATPLSPSEWRRLLAEGVEGKAPLILDVRNGYEWDAGHFEGAQRPVEDEFNETPTESTPLEIPQPLTEADPDTPVMMYCTGGIRCDVYSTYLKKKGYKNLFTLEGGIQNYMKKEGIDHWNGSLFVFDGRMAIRPNKNKEEPLEAASPCSICGGTAALPHVNCANIDCNDLFIACDECKQKFSGCCCEECQSAPRLLRPVKTSGYYGTWQQYAESEDEVHMARGRGEGRISRRRKRQQAVKEREVARRALKVERRRYAKEVMAEKQAEVMDVEQQSGSGAVKDERLARLNELRQRLLTMK